MDYQKIFELYEKLYFHEAEVREKISARLQIPLAIIFSFVSVYAIFIKNINFNDITLWHYSFFLLIFISLVLFVINCIFFIKAFYGHTYEFLPSAQATEKYRQKLIDTYKEREDCDELVSKYFSDYLFNYYSECSSINTKANDKRSDAIHKANTFSILNVLPLVVAFIMFAYSGIDKNIKDREYRVNVTNALKFEAIKYEQPTEKNIKTSPSPTGATSKESSKRGRKNTNKTTTFEKIEGKIMSKDDQKPNPPPPPPPPTRLVKDSAGGKGTKK